MPTEKRQRQKAGRQARLEAEQKARKRKVALRRVITLVIVAVVVVFAALGVGGWVGYSKYQAKQALKKGNPAAVVAAPTTAQTSSAMDTCR